MFDPNELTVKDARSQLDGLDLDGLDVVLRAEIDGKHRSSLIADIGRAIDAIKTAESDASSEDEVEEVVEEVAQAAPAPAPVAAPAKRRVSQMDWYKLPREVKKLLISSGDGYFVEK